MRHLSAIVAFTVSVFVLSPAAQPHPHMWIDVGGTFLFDGRVLTGVRFQWKMDEFFSAGVIQTFDIDKSGTFDADEQAKVRAQAFEGVKESNYFTDLLIDNEKMKIERTTDFAADIVKGQVIYHFTVPLDEPVDPAKTPVAFSVYDITFYVDVSLIKVDPIRFQGLTNGSCHFFIDEDRQNPILYGVVFPDRVDLLCGE